MFKPYTIGTVPESKKSDLSAFFSQLLIVIVLFERKPEQSTAYSSIHDVARTSGVFPEVFLYDNSSNPSPVSSEKITYRHDPLNPGVSKAYNTASVFAENNRKSWMLLLDQDTGVTAEFFEKLQVAIRAHPETVAFVPRLKDQQGVVSPFYFAFGGGKRINPGPSFLSLRNHRFANSGLTVKLSAFQAVGGYDLDTPLDFSDISFAERLKAITDHFGVLESVLSHDFSDNTNMQPHDALSRFHRYCVGASSMSRKSRFPSPYAIRSFLRACRLCVRYKSVRFPGAFFRHFFHG